MEIDDMAAEIVRQQQAAQKHRDEQVEAERVATVARQAQVDARRGEVRRLALDFMDWAVTNGCPPVEVEAPPVRRWWQPKPASSPRHWLVCTHVTHDWGQNLEPVQHSASLYVNDRGRVWVDPDREFGGGETLDRFTVEDVHRGIAQVVARTGIPWGR